MLLGIICELPSLGSIRGLPLFPFYPYLEVTLLL